MSHNVWIDRRLSTFSLSLHNDYIRNATGRYWNEFVPSFKLANQLERRCAISRVLLSDVSRLEVLHGSV